MKSKITGWSFLLMIVIAFAGCSKDWLKPEPLSFFTPENTFVDKAGLESVLLACRRNLGVEYYGSKAHIGTAEYTLSDISVFGGPSDSHDLTTQMLPNYTVYARVDASDGYWAIFWKDIKDANTVISHIDDVKWTSDAEKNAILAEGFFHRSYRYYRLANQYGDIPFILEESITPKLDFYSYTRESIIKKLIKDMEFSVQWLPENVLPGMVSRAAGQHLLTKLYLQAREFDKAIEAASWVIEESGHSLMGKRFGKYAGEDKYDVMWDLHQKENKSSAENKEVLLVVQDKFGMQGNFSGGTSRMRDWVPAWWWTPVLDPSGKKGVTDGKEGRPQIDSIGRGIGHVRSGNYFNYTIWSDPNDLRHSDVNWFSKDEFYYNLPSSPYYRKPFDEKAIGLDSIRCWYPFPYNKVYVFDEERSVPNIDGGHSDWYVFRLAETYLLRAEAYYWKNDLQKAADDINEVRRRAHADDVKSQEIDLEYIFAERARELFCEEPRKTELVRASYIMAQLNRDGYTLENMSKKSWFYDMVMKHNNFYANRIMYGSQRYIMEPYHVYWPIPQSSIDANTQGFINQNEGYPASRPNVAPLDYK